VTHARPPARRPASPATLGAAARDQALSVRLAQRTVPAAPSQGCPAGPQGQGAAAACVLCWPSLRLCRATCCWRADRACMHAVHLLFVASGYKNCANIAIRVVCPCSACSTHVKHADCRSALQCVPESLRCGTPLCKMSRLYQYWPGRPYPVLAGQHAKHAQSEPHVACGGWAACCAACLASQSAPGAGSAAGRSARRPRRAQPQSRQHSASSSSRRLRRSLPGKSCSPPRACRGGRWPVGGSGTGAGAGAGVGASRRASGP